MNRRKVPQHDKDHLWKTTVDSSVNCETLKAFPLRSGTKQGSLLSPLLFNMSLNGLAGAVRQEKVMQIGKEEVKLFCSKMT